MRRPGEFAMLDVAPAASEESAFDQVLEPGHYRVLRLRELETLGALAKNPAARLYIGFDKHRLPDDRSARTAPGTHGRSGRHSG